jgi:hypothetical protein
MPHVISSLCNAVHTLLGRRAMRLALLTAVVIVALPATAAAQEPVKETRLASVTFSPIHLIFPIVEVTGEFAVHPKIGVAGIVGYGSIPFQSTLANTERLTAWEVGAHFNYYVIGTFDHGMQLGAEAMYMRIAQPSSGTAKVSLGADGFTVGPYVGYKIITNIGFTFEANLGFQYLAARAKASDNTTTATASDKRILPLLNLNIGWSF